jgi:hypothetical protein
MVTNHVQLLFEKLRHPRQHKHIFTLQNGPRVDVVVLVVVLVAALSAYAFAVGSTGGKAQPRSVRQQGHLALRLLKLVSGTFAKLREVYVCTKKNV